MWEYFEQPGREDLLDRFAAAMEGLQNIEPPNLAEEGDSGQICDMVEFQADSSKRSIGEAFRRQCRR